MHRSSEAVLRTLAVSAIALVAVFAAGTASPARLVASCSPSSSWGTNRADLATQVVSLINQYRAGKSLPQLSLSAPLTASSRWKSLHMAANGYFDHNDPAPPVARTAFQRAKDCGYTGGAWEENIAVGYATAQSAVNGWLGSSGHRANIENAGYTTTGVGVAADASGRLYWTQSFGDDVSAGAAPPSASTQTAPAPASSPPSSKAVGQDRIADFAEHGERDRSQARNGDQVREKGPDCRLRPLRPHDDRSPGDGGLGEMSGGGRG